MIAILLRDRDELAAARPLFERALRIRRDALGQHPAVAEIMVGYAKLLRRTGEDTEAESMEARALSIRDP